MLTIRIHEMTKSPGGIQPGGQSGLVPKVAGQFQDDDPFVLLCERVHDRTESSVEPSST
jgi:hypothetical protein